MIDNNLGVSYSNNSKTMKNLFEKYETCCLQECFDTHFRANGIGNKYILKDNRKYYFISTTGILKCLSIQYN